MPTCSASSANIQSPQAEVSRGWNSSNQNKPNPAIRADAPPCRRNPSKFQNVTFLKNPLKNQGSRHKIGRNSCLHCYSGAPTSTPLTTTDGRRCTSRAIRSWRRVSTSSWPPAPTSTSRTAPATRPASWPAW